MCSSDLAGVVRDVDVDPDDTMRPEPATTLAAVRMVIGRSQPAASSMQSAFPIGEAAERRITMDVPRIAPAEVRRRVQNGQALLVCGYEDERKCRAMALEGAITLNELKRRHSSLPKSQELIFYCA